MYGLTIGQDNHAEKPVLHFWHLHPTPEAAISLHRFPNRCPNGPLDPFVSYDRPIRPLTKRAMHIGASVLQRAVMRLTLPYVHE